MTVGSGMKRTELKRGKRKTPLKRKGCVRHRWCPTWKSMGTDAPIEKCVNCDATRPYREPKRPSRKTTLKKGRGFAASPEQREKVKGMACVGCGAMEDEYTIIDPMHLCARGMGGCDDPLCVVPGCRTTWGGGCHPLFDEGKLDLTPKLEPFYRREVAHCVMHLGLFGAVRRLSGSGYRDDSEAAA